ncbi:hypothetical protein BpHYR1_037532 [Brachionus plicatilis]|uniref:Uncharacterized protein n=1 Tax=Brachionus plicatilis TaxID=10195 RepID=A0A3M7RZG7_BRAPC|nr:hypothetical protein BpHYR1_037532 [Brachionus plicatilis]
MILTLKLKKSRYLYTRKRVVLEKYATLKVLLKRSPKRVGLDAPKMLKEHSSNKRQGMSYQ